MKHPCYYILCLATLGMVFFAEVGVSLAKTDLSLTASDVTFSAKTALAGEKTRIFARVFNLGDEDAYGFVIFTVDNEIIGEPQAISVKVGTYDDVFIDWVFGKGNHAIGAGIAGTQPQEENIDNNAVIQPNFFIDSDSDGDGIGDASDNDSDNDGLDNNEEMVLGTDIFKSDTDNDKINDKEDVFPLDFLEWQDSDNDGVGDNLDIDDDNDNLTDEEEMVLGTNSLKIDTDGDLIPDKTEVRISFLNPNRNEWHIAGNYLASVFSAVKMAAEQGNEQVGYLFSVLGFLFILWLILKYARQRKK